MQSSEAYGNKANLKRFNITQFHISMSLLCEMSFDEQSQIGKDKNIYSTCNSIVTKKNHCLAIVGTKKYGKHQFKQLYLI